MGPYVSIGNDVIIAGSSIGHDSVIGDHCFLAAHAVVLGSVTIGAYSMLGRELHVSRRHHHRKRVHHRCRRDDDEERARSRGLRLEACRAAGQVERRPERLAQLARQVTAAGSVLAARPCSLMAARFRPRPTPTSQPEHEVFCRAEGGLRRRHGFAWVDPPLAGSPRSPDTCCRATRSAASSPRRTDTSWGSAPRSCEMASGSWPPSSSTRTIRAGASAAGCSSWPRGTRRRDRITITDAIQPVSNALYTQYGLIPTTPVLLFEGSPSIDAPSASRAGSTAPRRADGARPGGLRVRPVGRPRVLATPTHVHGVATRRGSPSRTRIAR